MNRDLFNNANLKDVGIAAMSVIDRLQLHQPHVQMAAAAVVFLGLSEHWGIPAQDVFTAVKNMINDGEGKRPEYTAVREYIRHEL
ncbi:MAG: hypothetical protein ACK4FJ_18700 [Ferrovibrio sp.]|uniref:hypothetical protein n=1 Tax=Ferrovibrio sp. TaxID=1917215 RepID=UPI00391B3000